MTLKEKLNFIHENAIDELNGYLPIYHELNRYRDEIQQALTELEELKSTKIMFDKEDTERYLNVFGREVLKQLVKEIEDKKKNQDT